MKSSSLLLTDKDEKISNPHPTNNLTTVYEHGSTNDLLASDESWQIRSPPTINNPIDNQRTMDEKQIV